MCLSLVSEMNGGKFCEAPNDAKNKCRVFVLASDMNDGNIRLRTTLKEMLGVCLSCRK